MIVDVADGISTVVIVPPASLENPWLIEPPTIDPAIAPPALMAFARHLPKDSPVGRMIGVMTPPPSLAKPWLPPASEDDADAPEPAPPVKLTPGAEV
jgi:hypothetical protein